MLNLSTILVNFWIFFLVYFKYLIQENLYMEQWFPSMRLSLTYVPQVMRQGPENQHISLYREGLDPHTPLSRNKSTVGMAAAQAGHGSKLSEGTEFSRTKIRNVKNMLPTSLTYTPMTLHWRSRLQLRRWAVFSSCVALHLVHKAISRKWCLE